DLATAVQRAAAVRDPGLIGCADGDVRTTGHATDIGIADHGAGPVLGHPQRHRSGDRRGRALVLGGIDANAEADVDLLGRIVGSDSHARGIGDNTVIQPRGGLVFYITVGHRAGDGCAALIVV